MIFGQQPGYARSLISFFILYWLPFSPCTLRESRSLLPLYHCCLVLLYGVLKKVSNGYTWILITEQNKQTPDSACEGVCVQGVGLTRMCSTEDDLGRYEPKYKNIPVSRCVPYRRYSTFLVLSPKHLPSSQHHQEVCPLATGLSGLHQRLSL